MEESGFGIILKIVGANLVRYLRGLVVFVFSPSQYIRSVCDDSKYDICARLLLYSILSTIVQYSALSTLDWTESPNSLTILGVSMLDISSALFIVPVFYFVARLARITNPLRSVFIFTITYRSVYLALLTIPYVWYLFTEDYAFAFVKGVSFWVYIVVHLLLFPISITSKVRTRAAMCVVTIATLVALGWGSSLLIPTFPDKGKNPLSHSVLSDPIGAEFDRVRKEFTGGLLYDEVRESWDCFMSTIMGIDLDVGTVEEHNAEYSKIHHKLNQRASMLDSSWAEQADSLSHLRNRVKFNTSKDLIDMRIEEIELARAALNSLNFILANTDSSAFREGLSSISAVAESGIGRLKYALSKYESRNMLRRWGLLYDWE